MTILSHPSIQETLTTEQNAALLQEKEDESRSFLLGLSRSDIELEIISETREVEIFELQHRALHDEEGEYEGYIFSSSPYAPLSPARVAGDRPKGTPFFEDVQPPRGWRWSDKKWTLDLFSGEWVDERCVTGVEVEMEGERWVTDLHYEDLILSESESKKGGKQKKIDGGRGRDKERGILRRTWEVNKPSRKGEWRRRRWVRAVERVPVSSSIEL